MDNRENILRLNRDRDPSFSEPSQREYRGNYQQKRPWKPHGGYKRLNEKKYAPRLYYSDNTGGNTGGDYQENNFFNQYATDRSNYTGGAGGYGYGNYGGYSGKGSEFNAYTSQSGAGMSTAGYGKGGYQSGGQMGTTYGTGVNTTYNYPEYNQNVKGASHHSLRTGSNEFYTGHSEIKDFSEQFVIKKAAPKSPEKKKKAKKQTIEDRVPDSFFENKGMIPTQLKNAESDEEGKGGN